MRTTRKAAGGSARRSSRGQTKPAEIYAALAAVGIILGCVAAYLIWSAAQKPTPKVDLLVAVDTSGSVQQEGRQKLFGVFDDAVDTVLPQQTRISFWGYDVNAHKVADMDSHKSRDLWSIEDQIIATHTNSRGTYPSVVLEKIVTAARQCADTKRSCACMILTDGEDADPKNTDRLMAALASMPNVKALWIEGVSTQNGFRSELERRFRPVFGNRLVLSSDHDAQTGLDRFRELIEKN